MSESRLDAVVRFFTKIANQRPLRLLSATAVTEVCSEFRDIELIYLEQRAPSFVIDKIRSEGDASVLSEVTRLQERLHSLLPALLSGVSLPVDTRTAIGMDAASPVRLEVVLRRSGRHLTPELASAERQSLASAMLDDVLRRPGRCPFWFCEVCRRLIAQPGRGRSVRFCSLRCKRKGIPSAPRRSEYVAEYRRRQRAKDLEKAIAAIRGAARVDQHKRLKDAFPRKPRKALLHLLKRAREEAPNCAPAASKSSRRSRRVS